MIVLLLAALLQYKMLRQHQQLQAVIQLPLLEISGQTILLEHNPNTKASIDLREKIILPLITIQQYALMTLKAIERGDRKGQKYKAAYEKMIIRAFFGSINASRNAA